MEERRRQRRPSISGPLTPARRSAQRCGQDGNKLHSAAVKRQAGSSCFSRDPDFERNALTLRRMERRAGHGDADDGAVYRDQGGQPGFAAVLSHGRLLRAVLRGRRDRLARARHRAHQARQAPGPRHPDVRRAGACRRRLSAEADRRRLPRRRLRADGGSGRGQEARLEIGGQARRHPAGDPGHHHRGPAARAFGGQLPDGDGACEGRLDARRGVA